MEETMALQTRPLSYSLGLEIMNVDLARVDDETFAEIRQAFLDSNGLLLFRDQELTRRQHIDFSRRFGELDLHEAVPLDRHPDHAEILIVANEPVVDGMSSNGRYIGQNWHSDLAPSLAPALGSLLRAIEIPPVGGDTMFTNMYAAYETLSDGMKNLIKDLHGVHIRGRKAVSAEWEAQNRKLNPPVAQPVVKVHRDTGRKALYIGEPVRSFEHMTEEESLPLIQYLVRHATRPQFIYRHQWRRNDLLFWDNRCTMHNALGDYDQSKRRYMERTTIKGDPCGYYCTVTTA
jgi:taurine dioxygenase